MRTTQLCACLLLCVAMLSPAYVATDDADPAEETDLTEFESHQTNTWFHQLPYVTDSDDAQRKTSGIACYQRVQPKDSDPADPKGPFVQRAAQAGFNYVHQERRVPPRCLLDDNENRKKVAIGGFCEGEINTGGATTADYDGDGFPDVFVSRVFKPPILYRNRGDGTFEDVTEKAGITLKESSSGAAFADVDKDGDLDLYVTTLGTKRFYLYINDGQGHFTEEALERGAAIATPYLHVGSTVAFGDFDGDGYPDLHTTEWAPKQNIHFNRPKKGVKLRSAERLLRNLGASAPGYFEDVTETANVSVDGYRSRSLKMSPGPYGFNSAFTDLDNDGRADLAVTGDFATTVLFWNEGNQTFLEGYRSSGVGSEMNGMGSTFGDLNNDGNMDWFITAIYDEKKRCWDEDKAEWCEIGWEGNRLFLNQGNRSFVDATDMYGVRDAAWAWGTTFLDFDNDGDLDLMVVNGFTIPSSTIEDDFNVSPNQLWVNEGGTLVNRAKEFGMEEENRNGRAVFVFDYDNDGDLDLFVANQGDKPLFYENVIGNRNPFLRVRVLQASKEPRNINVEVLGARVYVLPVEQGPVQWREIGTGSHLYGHSERTAHFGLGNPAYVETLQSTGRVARVLVVFPGVDGAEGSTVMIKDVPINSTLLVRQPRKDNMHLLNKLRRCPKGTVPGATSATGKVTWDDAAAEAEHQRDEDDDEVQEATTTLDAAAAKAAKEGLTLSKAQLATLLTHRTPEKLYATRETALIKSERTHDSRSNQAFTYTINGGRNNVKEPTRGQTWTRLQRVAPAQYSDGKAEPAGSKRPSARVVSNHLMAQINNEEWDAAGRNALHMTFGQFLAHDIDFTSPLPTFNLDTNFAISVPKGDTWFDVENTGTETLRFKRSMYDASHLTAHLPREQVNKITTWMDASNVYGSDGHTAREVRTGVDGTLASMPGDLIPFNTKGLGNDNPTGRYVTALHLSGDSRSNEQPGLFALHVVFFREHNRLCAELKQAHPTWNDDQLYQRARLIVSALLQVITYNEFLPATLGYALPPYTGYNSSVDATVTNEFATAAFRYGHSQVNTQVWRTDAQGKPIRFGNVGLRDAFFTPERLTREGGLDPILFGQVHHKSQQVDLHMVDDLRNFLFGPNKAAGGLDLAAANIQRGRDHGLADLNTVRLHLGLAPYTQFEEITSDAQVAATLRQLYNDDINDIDLWVGGLAEDHPATAAVGPTFAAIIEDQFIRLRDGDRFFYLNAKNKHFSEAQVAELEATTLADVIARNSGISADQLPKNIFFAPDAPINTSSA